MPKKPKQPPPADVPPPLLLRLRSYLEGRFVSAWLVRVDGAARNGLLHGDLTPQAAEELAAYMGELGLPVEREACPLVGATPLPRAGRAQGELDFGAEGEGEGGTPAPAPPPHAQPVRLTPADAEVLARVEDPASPAGKPRRKPKEMPGVGAEPPPGAGEGGPTP